MKRQLSPELTLHFSRNFPAYFGGSHKRYRVTLGVGGNLGDVRRRFERLLIYLRKDPVLDPVASAPVLKNPPFGYLEQKDFYNTVLIVHTNLRPEPFLRHLLRIEKRFKRKRSFKNAPRSLDLDIIFFDKFSIETKDLSVPHPRWSERESVVIPLRCITDGIKNI